MNLEVFMRAKLLSGGVVIDRLGQLRWFEFPRSRAEPPPRRSELKEDLKLKPARPDVKAAATCKRTPT